LDGLNRANAPATIAEFSIMAHFYYAGKTLQSVNVEGAIEAIDQRAARTINYNAVDEASITPQIYLEKCNNISTDAPLRAPVGNYDQRWNSAIELFRYRLHCQPSIQHATNAKKYQQRPCRR
jgi:hypothetical protein